MAMGEETDVCGETGDAEHAILEAQRLQPDVCIVGWDLPGGGLAAIHGIVSVAPGSSIVVLSEQRDVEDLLAAVRAGAVGYLPGSFDKDQLRRVVRGVAAQEAAVPRAMVRELILELRSATAMGGVTEREAQVLGMLRRRYTTAQIAQRLEISPITVRRYISDLMRKLGVDSREDLLRLDRGGDRSSADGAEKDGAGRLDGPPGSDTAHRTRTPGPRRRDSTADCAI
jgi:DNA-binding NarL/FixJ family response regulator